MRGCMEIGRLQTIKVFNEDGYKIINLADFDPARHVKWREPNEGEPEPGPKSSEIPMGWRALHWKRRAALAEAVTGLKFVNGADADAAIEEHLRDAV